MHGLEEKEGSNAVEGSKNLGNLDDVAVQLELVERKIQAIDDPESDKLPELIKQRKTLMKAMRIDRLQKELKRAMEGDDDGMFI
jgi:hypothetical protein